MKKVTAILMIITIALTFSACNEKKTSETKTENVTKTEEITSLAVDENIAVQYYAATKELIPAQFSEEMAAMGNYVEFTQNDLECYMADVTGDKIDVVFF